MRSPTISVVFSSAAPSACVRSDAAQRALGWARREPKLAAALSLALLALLAGFGATLVQRQRAEASASAARANAWAARHETAWRLFEDRRGSSALPLLATNLQEQQAAGADDAAAHANACVCASRSRPMPQPLDATRIGAAIDVIALSPDGRWLAVGMQPDTVALYDFASLRQQWRVKLATHGTHRPDPKLRRLVFSADGRSLVVYKHWLGSMMRPSAGQGSYRLALADGRQTHVPDAAQIRLQSWSDDGRHVILTDRAGSWLQLLDSHGWKPLSPRVPAKLADFSPTWLIAPDLSYVASRSADGSIEILDPRTLQPRHVLRPRDPDRGYDLGFIAWAASPDGHWLALGTRGSAILLVDARTGESRTLYDPQGVTTTWLTFSADSRHLGASNENGEFMLFRVPDGLYYAKRPNSVWGFQFDCDAQENCTVLLMEIDRVTLWAFAGSELSGANGVMLSAEITHHSYVPRFASALDARRRLLVTGARTAPCACGGSPRCRCGHTWRRPSARHRCNSTGGIWSASMFATCTCSTPAADNRAHRACACRSHRASPRSPPTAALWWRAAGRRCTCSTGAAASCVIRPSRWVAARWICCSRPTDAALQCAGKRRNAGRRTCSACRPSRWKAVARSEPRRT